MAGKFKLKTPAPGRYILRISLIGFIQTDTAPFDVSDPGFSKDFGAIVLKQDVKELKEVNVQALRPTIRQV